MIAIETRHLTRRYGNTIAVNDLSIKIPRGSLVALIGPNGAGKTTTLRMMAGLLSPTKGEIIIDGQPVIGNSSELRRKIGYMPDFFGVYEDLLVWEYLDFFARCYDLPANKRKQIVGELLELVELEEKRESYVQTLSLGMRQRLCLAHALIHEPQVLLLDEPASGLDPRARVEMRELLRELGAMGKTILLSSHILSELAELCDSVAIIEKGTLVASGMLDSIRAQISSDRKLHIRVLTDAENAQGLIQRYPGVNHTQLLNGSNASQMIEVSLSGDENHAAALLKMLVENEVRVIGFEEHASGLEDLFLQVTKGEVS